MAEALHSGDKLVLLLSLVPYLVQRGEASVAEAAAHFGVSAGQIRAAMSLIAVSGLPGETATYQHDDLFDIDWDAFEHDRLIITNRVAIEDAPRLSAREASALIAGLQYLSALPDNADNELLDGLLAKLARGASDGPNPVAVGRPVVDQSLRVLGDAIAQGVEVEFDYMNSRGDRERRTVDPLRIDSRDTDWYLKGWCHLREGLRTFRIDRISGLTRTDRPIESRGENALVAEGLFQAGTDDLMVDVAIAEDAVGMLREFLAERVGTSSDGRELWRLRAVHFHGLKRMVAAHPGVVEVLDPLEAREAVRQWALAGSDRYR